MPIIEPVPIPAAPPAPQRNDPATFEERNDAAVEYQFNTLPAAINQQSEAAYQNALSAHDDAQTAESAREAIETVGELIAPIADDIPVVAANDANITTVAENIDAIQKTIGLSDFKGAWEFLTGPLTVPSSVHHRGEYWQLLTDIPDVTASEPGETADWTIISFSTYGIGDLKYSLQEPVEDGWVEGGKVYLQSEYPDLFGLVGLINDTPLGLNISDPVLVPALPSTPGSFPTAFFRTSTGRIFILMSLSQGAYSDDDGETWVTASIGAHGVNQNNGIKDRLIELSSGVLLKLYETAGAVKRSLDDGESWTDITVYGTASERIISLGGISAAAVFASGNTKRVYITSDSGLTWSQSFQFSSTGSVRCGVALSELHWVFATSIGEKIETLDGGANWVVTSGFFGNRAINGVLKYGERVIFYGSNSTSTGGGLFFLISTDGGATYSEQYSISTSSMALSIVTINPYYWLLFTNSVAIYFSTDQGSSWGLLRNATLQNYASDGLVINEQKMLIAGGTAQSIAVSDANPSYDPETMFYLPAGPIPPTDHYKPYVRAA